jgi:CHRD domain
MGRRGEGIGLAVGLALALAGSALAAKPQPPAKAASFRVLVQDIPLSPRTGSPHGEAGASGAVTVCLDPSSNSVAYNFTALTLADNPTKGQIRQGTAGKAAVTFGAPGLIDPTVGEVEWNDTSPSSAAVVTKLASSPHGFYVTVNTRAYPNGALRGRLTGWKKVSSDSDAAAECAFS